LGLVTEERWARFSRKQEEKGLLREWLRKTRLDGKRVLVEEAAGGDRPSLDVWLRRPEASWQAIGEWAKEELKAEFDRGAWMTVETETKYAGYISQQERQIARLMDAEERRIPGEFSYRGIPGLSREIQEKLERVGPETLGQARRIPGVTPAAIAVLDVYLRIALRGNH